MASLQKVPSTKRGAVHTPPKGLVVRQQAAWSQGTLPPKKDDPPAHLPNVTALEKLFVLILLKTASK